MTNYQLDPSQVSTMADGAKRCRMTGGPVRVSDGGEEFVLLPMSKYREIEEELSLAELDRLIEEGLADDRAGRVKSSAQVRENLRKRICHD